MGRGVTVTLLIKSYKLKDKIAAEKTDFGIKPPTREPLNIC
jgi:hypothetical protein